MKAALKAGFSSNYVAARKHMRAHGADSDSDEVPIFHLCFSFLN